MSHNTINFTMKVPESVSPRISAMAQSLVHQGFAANGGWLALLIASANVVGFMARHQPGHVQIDIATDISRHYAQACHDENGGALDDVGPVE